MNISHISISRRDIYKQCPQKYKFKYHLKVENPEPEPFYFTYGKIIHKIAEEYILRKGTESLNEIKQLVLNGDIPIENYDGEQQFAPPVPTSYKNRIPTNLTAIEKLTRELGYDGETEWKFHYDLDPPNEKFVTGFLDRLVPKDNKFVIIDYKTTKKGKFRKNKHTIREDPQLMCYARVVQKTFDVPAENILCALYYVEDGDLLGVRFTQKQLAGIESLLLEVYNQIESHNPDAVRGIVGRHCDRCEYASICPFLKPRVLHEALR